MISLLNVKSFTILLRTTLQNRNKPMFLPSRRNIPQGKIQYNISISINIKSTKI